MTKQTRRPVCTATLPPDRSDLRSWAKQVVESVTWITATNPNEVNTISVTGKLPCGCASTVFVRCSQYQSHARVNGARMMSELACLADGVIRVALGAGQDERLDMDAPIIVALIDAITPLFATSAGIGPLTVQLRDALRRGGVALPAMPVGPQERLT